MTQTDSWTKAVRQRAEQLGYAALGDAELIALLVRRGAGGAALHTAARVLDELGDIARLSDVSVGRIRDVAGLSGIAAERLAVTMELARRIQLRQAAPRRRFVTPARVAEWMVPRIGALEEEQLWVLALDGRNRLRGLRCAARGGAHGLSVTARDILRAALSEGASAFIVVHNHPSGDHLPSAEDVWMTGQLQDAAEVVGVPLLDHVIVTADGSYSSLYQLGDLVHRSSMIDSSEPLNDHYASEPQATEALSLPFVAGAPHDLLAHCRGSPEP